MARDHIALMNFRYKEDHENITYSSVFEHNGIPSIRIYFERINKNKDDFDHFTYIHPSGEICDVTGYSEKEIEEKLPKIPILGEVAMETLTEQS